MKDPEQLRELIAEKVDLGRVMLDYNVSFIYDPMAIDEVQYRCPFHGKDNKPSARFYRSTRSCYCWVCKRKWDVVSFIRDAESLPHIQAIKFAIEKYNVDVSNISDEPDLKKKAPPTPSEIKIRLLSVHNRLNELMGRRPFKKYNALRWSYHAIMYQLHREQDVLGHLVKLETKLKGA